MERRIVAQLFDSIDFISSLGNIASNPNPNPSESATNALNGGIAQAIIGSIDNNNIGTSMDVATTVEESAKSKMVVLIAATNK
jgi:hypothetical protein